MRSQINTIFLNARADNGRLTGMLHEHSDPPVSVQVDRDRYCYVPLCLVVAYVVQVHGGEKI